MEKFILKGLRAFTLIILGPLLASVFVLISSFGVWGPGLEMLGLAVLTMILSGLITTITLVILRKKTFKTKLKFNLISPIIVGFGFLSFQFWTSSPQKLLESLLEAPVPESIEVIDGKLEFTGFDHEIWISFKLNKEDLEKITKSRPFKETNKTTPIINFGNSSGLPKWWKPAVSGDQMKCFEYKNDKYETVYKLWIESENEDKVNVYYNFVKW